MVRIQRKNKLSFGSLAPFSGRAKPVVILGPTSSGKSEIAVELAQEFNGEIISADSRQIYKNLNLAAGKVPGQWQEIDGEKAFVYKKILHHLIDFIDPNDEYNVSHFQRDCQAIIKKIQAKNKLPIICGGTGFWILAVVDNVVLPKVRPDLKLRKELEKKSNEELFQKLEILDSQRAQAVDKKNKVRLIRAIEICQALGQVPKLPKIPKSSQNFLQIGIDHPMEILEKRIESRLKERFSEGMVEEVQKLKEAHGLSWKEIQSFGLAYFWIPQYLQGKIDLDELKKRVYLAERQFAKRQKTWFKRDKRIVWENQYEKIRKLVSLKNLKSK